MYEFKWRMHDPAIGRFMQIDPLAEDYSYQSPYNFAENRVINGIELEGLEWVNANGVKVYDSSANNGKGAYTDAATNFHRNIGKSLRQTETGEAQFQQLVTSNTKIQTVANNTDKPTKDGKPIGAITGDKGNIPTTEDIKGNVIGATVEKATITFFLKNIDDQASAVSDGDNSTGASLNGTAIPEGFNFSDIIGAIFGHEIGHTTEENTVTNLNGGNIEKVPTQISNKIIEETQKKKDDKKD